ncbi:hypothetical protein L9F63_012206, partial [Diploptera punctata]
IITEFNHLFLHSQGEFTTNTTVHLLREKLELCNKDGAHATVVHRADRKVTHNNFFLKSLIFQYALFVEVPFAGQESLRRITWRITK